MASEACAVGKAAVVGSCGKAGRYVSVSGYRPGVPGPALCAVLILNLGLNSSCDDLVGSASQPWLSPLVDLSSWPLIGTPVLGLELTL